MSRISIVVAVSVLALACVVGPSGAVCPTSSWHAGPVFGSSTEPVYSFGFGSYNLVAGTFNAAASGGGELGMSLQLDIRDTYRLVGPASATPIAFRARVQLTGYADGGLYDMPPNGVQCAGSNVTFDLQHGAELTTVDVVSSSDPCQGAEVDHVAELELSKLPGEDFELRLVSYLYGNNFAASNVSGVLTFLVPAGYAVASCQGYAGLSVPAAASSWGRIKQTYR